MKSIFTFIAKTNKKIWMDLDIYSCMHTFKKTFPNSFNGLKKSNHKLKMQFKQLLTSKKYHKIMSKRMDEVKKHLMDMIANDHKFVKGIKYSENHDLFCINEQKLKNTHNLKYDSKKDLFLKHQDKKEHNLFIAHPNYQNNIKKYKKSNFKNNVNKLNITNILDVKYLIVESGLGILIKYMDKNQQKSLIFDAGNFIRYPRLKYIEDIKSYFINENQEITVIISHMHYDHYSIMNNDNFKNFISKFKKSNLVFYNDTEIATISKIATFFKTHISLKLENNNFKLGNYNLNTYLKPGNDKGDDVNKTSMVLWRENFYSFNADQFYENIPVKSNFIHFQVPHHGSARNGNYSTVKNKFNYVPLGKYWKLPNKDLVKYMKSNLDGKRIDE